MMMVVMVMRMRMWMWMKWLTAINTSVTCGRRHTGVKRIDEFDEPSAHKYTCKWSASILHLTSQFDMNQRRQQHELSDLR